MGDVYLLGCGLYSRRPPRREEADTMIPVLEYDDTSSRRLDYVYTSHDVVAQRGDVLTALALQPGEHVLDVGVGPGFLAKEMAEAVGGLGSVTGIDVSRSMLGMARSRCSYPLLAGRIHLHEADATALPCSNAVFDAAVATQAYEYGADVPAALAELCRVLKPGGRALVLDTDWDSIVWNARDPALAERILAAWGEHATDSHLPRILSALLLHVGFQIVSREVLVLFNPQDDPDSYSYRVRDLIAAFVLGKHGLSKDDVELWLTGLRRLGIEGRYFFSLNRYLFLVVKPRAGRSV
jgi:arsenite methyltransferase